jgi:hypothetical protein
LARNSQACRLAPPRPGSETAENGASFLCALGQHQSFRNRPLALGDGSCLLPLKLLLLLRRTTSRSPALSELIASKGSSPVCGQRLPKYRSLRGADSHFSRSGCDTGSIWRLVNLSFTAGTRFPHTGSQSQLTVCDRLRSPFDPKSRTSRASLGLRMISPCFPSVVPQLSPQ